MNLQDDDYNDEHVKRLAIFLSMEEIDLEDLAPAESFAIGTALGLTIEDYIGAVRWLNPDHAEVLRKHAHHPAH